MAAKILDDILNKFLNVDNLLEWLSNKEALKENDTFMKQYECTEVEFISYFLAYLREQSSRDFQVYDAETPRKNSYSGKFKNINTSAKRHSPSEKYFQKSSSCANYLDLESLQSFPTLSSCSSTKMENNDKKFQESASNNFVWENSNNESTDKRLRQVKLFSETLEENLIGNESFKKDMEFLEDAFSKCGNKILISTPKPLKNDSLPDADNSDKLDLWNTSPKSTSKPSSISNNSEITTSEINSLNFKSRIFGDDTSQKNKNKKTGYRRSLGDFTSCDLNIAAKNKKEKKGKTKKRINPTKASNSLSFNSSSLQDKSVEFLHGSDNTSALNFSFENQTQESFTKKDAEINKETNIDISSNSSTHHVQPELELATFTDELKILSKIYSFLISENFCQNIMIELCFIVSLLVIQDRDKKILEPESNSNGRTFFGSVHNCVFFAVEMLWLQKNCLLLLNLPALKLLSENSRIDKFNIDLKEFIVNAYSHRQSSEELKRHRRLIKTGMQGNVSFQYETDNRENFTSDFSFHSFRKQRDLFYNILAIWEANHLVSGWIFSVGLGSKIRSLLSISSDPINLLHFSRLFRNQLIMSCCGENQEEEDLNEKIFQLLPGADPNKILRLRARLTSSPKRLGPCPLPDFTGHQEFYKDFILCASHSTFREHLKNSLCDEILRLNDTDLNEDIEDEDSSLDEQTEERYLQCANILRLLAKFLGFLEFMPYRGEKSFSDRILNIHCSVRINTLPVFDVFACLQSAIDKRRLILTIPWIVSYLSMIDPYSAQLKIYQNVWRLLIIIYKHLKTFNNVKNCFYLRLSLGWIFQLPSFPSDQFYNVLDEYNKGLLEGEVAWKWNERNGLDTYDIVDETVIYAICPYLNEINVILRENLGCNVRHVRPVTTQESSFSKLQVSKQLELRLEGNFLHNQSSSTRKTVEFVTERVASIAIKHLIHNIIPKIKEATWAELERLSSGNRKEAEIASETLSESCYKELLCVCEKENWEIISKRSDVALKALLSSDLHESVTDTCAKIVIRQAMEKVERWMQSHVTLAMVKKEFLSMVQKKFEKISNASHSVEFLNKSNSCKDFYQLPNERKDVVHQQSAWPASRAIKAVRELICKANESNVTSREVEMIIEETINTVRHRNDLIPAAEKALTSLILDLVIVFCIHSKDSLDEIFKKLFLLLRYIRNQSQCGLERIICSRNVAIISKKATKKEEAWGNLGSFLLLLLEEGFLAKDQVETQFLYLFRHNYEKEDGNHFLKFISSFLDRYLKNYGCDKFSLLLEYIFETLNEDELKSDHLS